MSGMEKLMNALHREATRVFSRNTRRTPVVVSAYDPTTYAIKVKLMPDSIDQAVETGWLPLNTIQTGNNYGWHIPPRINDHGWLEFHEDDREAAFHSSSVFNDVFKPLQTQAGEWQYQTVWGHIVYFKQDGSLTLKNGTKQGANADQSSQQGSLVIDNQGTVTITAAKDIVLATPNGHVFIGGADASKPVSMLGTQDSEGNADVSNLATKAFAK